MKTFFKFFALLIPCIGIFIVNINWVKFPLNTNHYFDETLPGSTPKVFAPNIISDGLGNRDIAISPRGDEIFYTIQHPKGIISAIMYVKLINGKWTSPEVAPFSGFYNDLEPAFSSDGSALYFSSNRPLKDTGKTKDYDIWIVKKINGRWLNTTNAGAIINSKKDEFYAAPTKSRNIYFTRGMGNTKEDIVVCKFNKDSYDSAVSLPAEINSAGYEFNAYVDPDETMVIFTGYKKSDDIGGGDLYISLKTQTGEWKQAQNLGPNINSAALDYCPYVSPDKKYLFFTSSRSTLKTPPAHKMNIKQIKSALNSYGNGLDDIYWVELKDILNAAMQ